MSQGHQSHRGEAEGDTDEGHPRGALPACDTNHHGNACGNDRGHGGDHAHLAPGKPSVKKRHPQPTGNSGGGARSCGGSVPRGVEQQRHRREHEDRAHHLREQDHGQDVGPLGHEAPEKVSRSICKRRAQTENDDHGAILL